VFHGVGWGGHDPGLAGRRRGRPAAAETGGEAAAGRVVAFAAAIAAIPSQDFAAARFRSRKIFVTFFEEQHVPITIP
jgi:hypothetical protein